MSFLHNLIQSLNFESFQLILGHFNWDWITALCIIGIRIIKKTLLFSASRKIYLRLRKRKSMMERIRENKHRNSQTKRINAMLFSVVVAFGVCWLPLNIFNAVVDWNHEAAMSCTHDPLFSLCHLTAMCSVCVNPVFYGFLNRNFQRDMQSFRLCKRFSTREEDYDTVAMSTVQTDMSKASVRFGGAEI